MASDIYGRFPCCESNKKPEITYKVGDWVLTSKKVQCLNRCFEKGTKVKVIGVSSKGYDLEDKYGNQIFDVGFDYVEWTV